MSLLEYNIRTISIVLICYIGIIYALFSFVNKRISCDFRDTHGILLKVLCSLFIVIFVSGMVLLSSVVYEGDTDYQKGVVTEIIRTRSVGNIMVNYTFIIVDENHNETYLNSPLLSSRKFNNNADLIKEGDIIIAKCGKKHNYMYDFDIVAGIGDGSLLQDEKP